jgi:hypothetical protein
MEDELYEEYIEDAIEIAENNYEISKEEIIYNDEHFRQCYENDTEVEQAVLLLSNFCI